MPRGDHLAGGLFLLIAPGQSASLTDFSGLCAIEQGSFSPLLAALTPVSLADRLLLEVRVQYKNPDFLSQAHSSHKNKWSQKKLFVTSNFCAKFMNNFFTLYCNQGQEYAIITSNMYSCLPVPEQNIDSVTVS